jgi:8-oxo-dGTP pyrophosphatase MutT (NUDIX family)
MQEPGAAVAIVQAGPPQDSILLIRRAEREGDPWSGHWSLPGGRRDAEDADLLATALRELAEECDLRLSRRDVAEALPHMVARRRTPPFLLVAPFLFRVPGEVPAKVDQREAVEALWVPLGVLADPARHRVLPVPGMPANVAFPAIDLNGPPLWGFTYRLLTDWLGLLPADIAPQQAGFTFACRLLEFLVARGLAPRTGWTDRGGTRVAEVAGVIPRDEVLAWLSVPGAQLPGVNRVEVQADSILITGLAFEEYSIRAA